MKKIKPNCLRIVFNTSSEGEKPPCVLYGIITQMSPDFIEFATEHRKYWINRQSIQFFSNTQHPYRGLISISDARAAIENLEKFIHSKPLTLM